MLWKESEARKMQGWMAKYWLTAVFGVLTGALSWAAKHLWSRQKTQAARQKAVEEGVQALLRDRIYSGYAECLKKGYANVDDIKNLECLYRPYHALGGNGTGTEIYERIRKMPAEPAERG
jgi:hypothetical protein